MIGASHMDYLVREYVGYYHLERPHQALGNAPPLGVITAGTGAVACKDRLGGLLKHYYRKAA